MILILIRDPKEPSGKVEGGLEHAVLGGGSEDGEGVGRGEGVEEEAVALAEGYSHLEAGSPQH